MKKFSMFKQFVLMFIILSVLALLAFTLSRSSINQISKIKIEGNELLESDIYLKFAKLNNNETIENIGLSVIHDRLEKHPYIENVDVVMLERGVVNIKITEKKMEAILLDKNKQLLITSDAQLLPMLPGTRNIDLPIIDNYKKVEKLKLFSSIKKDESLLSALKIISTAEFVDKNLYENIATIDLHNGNNISLDVIDVDFPIFFGKENEVKKTVYLSKILFHLKNKKLKRSISYLDLRYDNLVYLGFDNVSMLKKGKT